MDQLSTAVILAVHGPFQIYRHLYAIYNFKDQNFLPFDNASVIYVRLFDVRLP
jgi:hypothetical protein